MQNSMTPYDLYCMFIYGLYHSYPERDLNLGQRRIAVFEGFKASALTTCHHGNISVLSKLLTQ